MNTGLYKGYMIVSDMDATLISSDHKISDENKDALKYFTENGGIFTVASGRMIDAIGVFYGELPINAPVIAHNGAKIYDFKTGKTIYNAYVNESRKKYVHDVYKNMPELGIEIYSDEEIYVYRSCRITERLNGKSYKIHYEVSEDIFNKPWSKLLYIGEKDVLDYYENIYRTCYDSGYAVRSGDNFLDIVAEGASKANAMLRVADMFKINHKNIAAIGDNLNDEEMIEAAGISFCVKNGVDRLKGKADFIAPDCDSDALKFVVEKIREIVC